MYFNDDDNNNGTFTNYLKKENIYKPQYNYVANIRTSYGSYPEPNIVYFNDLTSYVNGFQIGTKSLDDLEIYERKNDEFQEIDNDKFSLLLISSDYGNKQSNKKP